MPAPSGNRIIVSAPRHLDDTMRGGPCYQNNRLVGILCQAVQPEVTRKEFSCLMYGCSTCDPANRTCETCNSLQEKGYDIGPDVDSDDSDTE